MLINPPTRIILTISQHIYEKTHTATMPALYDYAEAHLGARCEYKALTSGPFGNLEKVTINYNSIVLK